MKQTVYLAGGLRTNWQEKVIAECCELLDFYNPREKEVGTTMNLSEFGSWDLHHIGKCDIFFGYMERTNPSGIGLSVELGFAKALGKTVILCLEENNEHQKDKYLTFMKKCSDVVYTDLETSITYLKSYGNI